MPDVAAATAKLEQANKNELAILRSDTVPGIGRAILGLRRSLQEIRGNTRISGSEMVTQTAAARAKAQASLDTIEATAKQAISLIRDDIASRTTVKRDPQEQLVYELQLAAAARRLDLLNAAKVDPAQIIARAAAASDRAMLEVIRADLPFFADPSDQASMTHLESLMDQLDTAELPLTSALNQAARILLDELKYGQMNLSTNFQITRGEASGASQSSSSGYPIGVRSVISGWAQGSSYNINETQPDGGNTSPDTPLADASRGAFQDNPQIAEGARARQAAVAASEAAMRRGRQ